MMSGVFSYTWQEEQEIVCLFQFPGDKNSLMGFGVFFLRSFIMRTLFSVIKAPLSLVPTIKDILILWSYLFDFWRIKKQQQAKLLYF